MSYRIGLGWGRKISNVLRNLALWPLLVFAIGAPINSLVPFAALLLGTLILLFARPKSSSSRWLAAAGLALIGGISLLAAPPVIEEGLNAFVPDYPQGAALRQDLPQEFYEKAVKLFDDAYPLGYRCNPRQVRNLRPLGSRDRFGRAYAFSADGLWSDAKYSRQTRSIDFHNIVDLRAGFVNDFPYFWSPRCFDLTRASIPFVVRYDLPASYRGGELCWTGMVMLQDRQGLRDEAAGAPRCMTLAFEAGPPVVFGMAAKGSDLALKITPPAWLRVWGIGLQAAQIGGTLLVLLGFLRLRYVPLALAAAGAIASLILVDRYEPGRHVYDYPFGSSVDVSTEPVAESNFRSNRVLPSDMDGFRHVGLARAIIWTATHGEFREALRGGEDAYNYMPGMRYLEAATLAIFGDSEFGPIFFAALTAAGLFYFIATYVDAITALVLCGAFLFGPKLLTQPFLFDFDIWLHVYLGHWADGAAALAFLTGSAILVRLADGRIAPSLGALAVPGILISAAVFLRANFGLAAVVVMIIGLRHLLPLLPLSRLVVVAASFVFLGTAALHNWFFAGRWVPFTDDVNDNLPAHPVFWAHALSTWLGIPLPASPRGPALITKHLESWLGDLVADEGTRAEFVWLRLTALVLLLAFVLFKRLRTPANMALLGIIVAAQLPLLFFFNTGRYGLLAWPTTMLGAVLVLRAAAAGVVDYSRRWRSIRAAPTR